jgi:uncharacterized lipoprotein YmbA
MTHMKNFLLLLSMLVLTACASAPPPPAVFKPLDYSYLRPIIFKVANLSVVNNYTPGPDETQLNSNNPAPPAATLLAMLNQRMQPSGQPGNATITVQVASITEGNGMLNGQMTVDINLTSADGRSTGFAEASVSASQTAPDSGDQNAVQAALYQMTKTLMDAINVQLPYQIAHNIARWVAWTTPAGGAAALPAGAAAGGIQATPLAAPGSAAASSAPGSASPAGSTVTTTTTVAPGAPVPLAPVPPTPPPGAGNLVPPGYPGAAPALTSPQ